MCYRFGSSTGGFGFLGFLIAVIILCAIIYFAYKVFGNNSNISKLNITKNNSSNSNNKALEILNERYSRGEISDEEYNFKKSQILR